MKIDGKCHCGFIAYEAEAELARTIICNCTDCQVLTGTAFRVTVPTEPGSFRLLAGEPSLYVKTADSGAQRQHAFCPRCGAPIYATSPGEDPKSYGVRVGTLSQRDDFAPTRQIWTGSQQPWVNAIADIPGVEGQA